MNRNPDGTRLSAEDLSRIALEAGLLTPETLSTRRATAHNENLFRSGLKDLTREVRFKLFWSGKLELDTQPDR